MSTRANICIKEITDTHTASIWLYHHHDGMPCGLGASLIKTIKDAGFIGKHYCGNCYGIATHLLKTVEPMYTDCRTKNEFELTEAMHGDVEFLYTITIENGEVSISCNRVEGGIIREEVDLGLIEAESKIIASISNIDSIESIRWFHGLNEKARVSLVKEMVEFVAPEKWSKYIEFRRAN